MIGDDRVLPFRTVRSGMSGRIVRLGATIDDVLSRHDYPEPVGHALGEALALTAMLGSQLKFEGRFILQTRTDGALSMVVANFDMPGHVRGYAAFEAAKISTARAAGRGDQGALLGSGHLAMTIDPGGDMDRYQGIVALSGQTLTDAALTYFRQSEQLPTYIRLAVARMFDAGRWSWRGGGLMIQHVAAGGGQRTERNEDDDDHLEGDDDENWTRVRLLAETVEDHELLDPALTSEALLYRLFHEEGVRVSPALDLVARCTCSRERVEGLLRQFGSTEFSDMKDESGRIVVTCEFCSTKYAFEPSDLV
jgi:molecular chaperone Hsp33